MPRPEYAENLRAILTGGRGWTRPRVLVMTPRERAALEEARATKTRTMRRDPDRDLNRTGGDTRTPRKVSAQKRRLRRGAAEPLDVAGLNLFDKLAGVERWEETMLSDGLHLSRAGYGLARRLWWTRWSGTLDLEADESPSDFPSFLDVDHRAPSASVDAFVVKKMRAARGELVRDVTRDT